MPKKIDQTVIIENSTVDSITQNISGWKPTRSLVVLIALVFFLLLGVITASKILPWFIFFMNRAKTNETLILVAEFRGTGGYDPTTRIYSNLQSEFETAKTLNKMSNARILRVSDSPQTNTEAITLGNLYGASIVMWGTFDVAGIEPHFEITASLNLKKFPADLKPTVNTDLMSFNLYMAQQLPSDFQYLTLLTLGKGYLFGGDPGSAIDAFSEALHVDLSNREKDMALHRVFALRATAYAELGKYDDANHDYEHSLVLEPSQPDTLN